MIDIIVTRGAGDKQGEDIVNPLICTENVAVFHGTNIINEEEPVERVDVVSMYRTGVRLGDLVEVHDSLYSKSWRGKIIGLSHKINSVSAFTTLTIERPQNY